MSACGWFPMKRDEIQAWVEAHRDTLPRTLAELARFPIPFRKVIVAAVEPALQISFWREHLETFLRAVREERGKGIAALRGRARAPARTRKPVPGTIAPGRAGWRTRAAAGGVVRGTEGAGRATGREGRMSS